MINIKTYLLHFKEVDQILIMSIKYFLELVMTNGIFTEDMLNFMLYILI